MSGVTTSWMIYHHGFVRGFQGGRSQGSGDTGSGSGLGGSGGEIAESVVEGVATTSKVGRKAWFLVACID